MIMSTGPTVIIRTGPTPTDFVTFDRVGDQAAGDPSFRFAWLVRRR
jgi:hypothetical protein